nr:hypothetical protein [Klebsiella aerogenes]
MVVIHKALDECSTGYPVFYESDVDIHLPPKIGVDWQLSGQQKRVVTPGQNEEYYLAEVLHTQQQRKISALFISLFKLLKVSYPRAKNITLIIYNYIIHKSRKTQPGLKANPKLSLLAGVNYVVRFWLEFYYIITCNHQCYSIRQLLRKVHHFMGTVSPSTEEKIGWRKCSDIK